MTSPTLPDAKLTTDLITRPSLYRLVIIVADNAIDVTITSRVDDDSVIHRHIPFQNDADPVAAIEETIYDNPLLTADFSSVNVIVDTQRFFVMATDDATPEQIRLNIDALWSPARTGLTLEPLVNSIETDRVSIVSAPSRRLLAFLRRTFPACNIIHRVAVLARYYAIKNRLGNMGKIHSVISPGRTDIIIFGRDGLLMANTFSTPTLDDAAFYTLAAARHLGFDNDADRIIVAGDRDLREPYIENLRRFVSIVMPDIFPTAFAALGERARKIPFETIAVHLIQ